MQTGKFNTVVDCAWGSSGKGAVSARLADIYNVENLSSANYPNAGHTVRIADKVFVFKSLPSGAALTAIGKRPELWLGCNSGFKQEVLDKELTETSYMNSDYVHVHGRAMVVEQRHIDAEEPGGSRSTLAISSTMSGSGAALTDKAMRGADVTIASKVRREALTPWKFWKDCQLRLTAGQTFLHEVSQGFALSLNWGTHYPYCTSRDCTPHQAYSDFGILPDQVGDVYLNVRSFPIRVGNNYSDGKMVGYSGDGMPDSKETSWDEIAANAGMPPDVAAALAESERTTVTKKVRRVFTQSWELLAFAAKFCGATKLVLNFPQYINWSIHKRRGEWNDLTRSEWNDLTRSTTYIHRSIQEYVDKMEEVTNLPVVMIGTGADHDDYIIK